MLNRDQESALGMLARSIESVKAQLAALGVACKGVLVLDGEGKLALPSTDASDALLEAVNQLFARVQQERQSCIARDGGPGFLVAHPLLTGDGGLAYVFVVWLEKLSEQTATLLQMAMGWLHLPFVQAAAERGSEASCLLEMQAQVFSQEKARAGAQEWVNRLAQLVRHGQAEIACSVLYFRMQDAGSVLPRWWVTSDTASAEKGAAVLHAASDAAGCAALEFRELQLGDVWSFPVVNEGEIVGVVVIFGGVPDERTKALVRASASVIGPLLAHWYVAQRGLWSHGLASARDLARKLKDPGFLTWKLGAAAVLLVLGLLLVLPFDDHAVAKVVIEGQKQQVISAPFEGYWSEVFVRPGDAVKEGQLMARLDTRDLKNEREKLASERDQAATKLRQVFADRDSASVQQVSAQLRQAEAQLALVESKLQRAEIHAPAEGVVISGDWLDQIGSPVEAGKKLFEIASGSGYRVVLQMPEEEIARVALGQKGEIRVTGLPQSQFGFQVSRITSVATVADQKNTFKVEARLDAPDAPMRPGMQGVGKVVVGRSNLLTIAMRPVAQWLRMKLWSMWW